MNATVKDVMTTEVVAVRREVTFKELKATLRRYRVSALSARRRACPRAT